ncbi:hypothetical protein L798_06120 [Zootermopsis nevadensis]|uniref:Uncharacterized protein n=1 Tax=Zootermopsis nevadensis TaxID=136037 RepID=A0A067R7I8_ZOONE|nr:hypothetical protein L798_06120 [Zootermopsis nevadensis]
MVNKPFLPTFQEQSLHAAALRMRAEILLETLAEMVYSPFSHLMRLVTQESFIIIPNDNPKYFHSKLALTIFVFQLKAFLFFCFGLGFCQYILRPKLFHGKRSFRSEIFSKCMLQMLSNQSLDLK